MRLGTRSPDKFIQRLGERNEEIQKLFVSQMEGLTEMIETKVMMGDSTVTEQKTFDPRLVSEYFQRINNSLTGWSLQDVSISNNEDVRRIFTKFEVREGNYLLSGHLSIQFHVLLYYKPDQRVLDCQKELSGIVDMTKDREQQMSDNSDQFVLDKLREMGYTDLDHGKLFEIFYENDEFRERIYSEIERDAGVDFQQLTEKKTRLFNELDSLLVETYQTVPVLIDDARLVGGEEGCLCTVDLEFIKGGAREGLFDPKKMSPETQDRIMQRLDKLERVIGL